MTAAFAEVSRLTVRHIGRRAPALRDLSMRWERGERLLVLGPSGGGKSTLALCLDGVIPHALDAHWEAGGVTLDGRDTRAAGLAYTTERVGVVFQDPEAQLVTLEIDDEIAFGLENRARPRAEIVRAVAEARDRFGLRGPRVPERLAALSGGMKQRVALASVMAGAPAGLVLDEPTANLDPEGRRLFRDALAPLLADRSRSLLFVEHRIDEMLAFIDRVVVLDGRGELAWTGGVDETFGTRAAQLDALGVWLPELTSLARILGSGAVPRGTADAARLIAERWPRGPAAAVPARDAGATVLEARGLAYRYPGESGDAVRDAGLVLRAGEIVALVGSNGAGKSTLGLLLAALLRPARGRLLVDGRPAEEIAERELRRRMAYVFQYPEHQLVRATVRDELLAGPEALGLGAAEAARRADHALERFALTALAPASPHSLSHGQKRRLSVATALVGDPGIIVLDEPTFGQDRRNAGALLALLDALRAEGRAIVAITHDLGLVADHADRAIVMADGAIAFDGAPARLFADDALLARAGLERPPVAEAFRAAHALRPDVPRLDGLGAAARALPGRGS